MVDKRKLSINFYLVILFSLICGFLNTAQKMHGIVHYKEIFASGYAIGTIIGFALFCLVGGFLLAIIINFIFNSFREVKKPFSYFWVWLFIILMTILYMAINFQQVVVDTPQNRQVYKQQCIDHAKATPKFQALNASDQATAAQKIDTFCDKAVQQYFQIYDQCMQQKNNVGVCVKQAEFEQCMALIKPDADYCNKLTQQSQ